MEAIKLSNGMTLCHEYDSSVALVTADLWIKCGAGDEPQEIAGVSHFLEHMIFKGTDNLAPGEYDALVEQAGGYLNAATSYDYTHYFITIPTDRFPEVFSSFADSMLNSVLDPKETDMERQVILEEIRRKADSPLGFLFDETVPQLFNKGPYRHPVIGYPDTVKAMTADQLKEHYHRYYAPERMYLSIVGDVKKQRALELAEEYFASFERAAEPWSARWEEPESAPSKERVYTRDWQQCYFIYSFPSPGYQSPHESAVCDLLDMLLSGGRNARLVKNIQEDQQLVSSIGALAMEGRSDSPFLIYGSCSKEKAQAVRASINEVLFDFQKEGPNEKEMARVRQMMINSYLFGMETGSGRANAASYSCLLSGNLSIFHDTRRALQQVKPEELTRFAKSYLDPDKGSFFLAGPVSS